MSILKAAWWHSALAMAGFVPGERPRPPERIPSKRPPRGEGSRAAQGARDGRKAGRQATPDGRRPS